MSRKSRAKEKAKKAAKNSANQHKKARYAAINREERGGRASVDLRTDDQRQAAYDRLERRDDVRVSVFGEKAEKGNGRSEKPLQPERYISRQILIWGHTNKYQNIIDFSSAVVLTKRKVLADTDWATTHETDVYVWGFEKDSKHPNKVYGIRDSKRIFQYTAQDNFGSFVFGEGNLPMKELNEKLYQEALKRAQGLARRFGKELVDKTQE